MAVSTGFLLEYEEVIARISGREHWQKFAHLMDFVKLTTRALLRGTHHHHVQIINHSPDDNIFTDCAITTGANYIITEDRHFAPLATAGQHPQPITPAEFISKH